jgi:hypothetical protein
MISVSALYHHLKMNKYYVTLLKLTECLIFYLGSAADLCKSAMLHTQHKLQEEHLAQDAHLLLQIHDELVWEVNTAQLTNVRGEFLYPKSRKSTENTMFGPVMAFLLPKSLYACVCPFAGG